MKRNALNRKIQLGVCYYPEHWPEENWKSDLEKMIESGLSTVRIAEFAWNLTEPSEGNFDFSFWDRFLSVAHEIGIRVIFCTPTATPPAWLTHKYPEVLNSDMDGHPICHGARRHCNYSSPIYREKCRIITEQLARHYASHPSIIGWQLDNEFNCENDSYYSDADNKCFRLYLQGRYHSLSALNDAWGTVFWNQTYTAWDEVFVPRRTNSGSVNPHLFLDYCRFVSGTICSFAREQAMILRKYIKPGDFITTNGIFDRIDYSCMLNESIDLLMYDSYPDFAFSVDGFDPADPLLDRRWSVNLAKVRSYCRSFGIMEQQSGANGWNTGMEAPSPRPGQMSLWTIQSIAHGADYVSFFRWRTACFGTEMYWHGILDYSGRENRRMRELRRLSEAVRSLSEVAGSEYRAKVGILFDQENEWDCQIDHWHGRIADFSDKGLTVALQLSHTPFDYICFHASQKVNLNEYALIFCPHIMMLTEECIHSLTEYVSNGGIVIFGCRTGLKDHRGHCVTEKLPGKAAMLAGTDITEYSLVPPDDSHVYADLDGNELEVSVFMELLAPLTEESRILATYKNGPYKGSPALISHPFGSGTVYYWGGAFCSDTALFFLNTLHLADPEKDKVTAPESCEIAVRQGKNDQYLFILNYSSDTAKLQIHKEGFDLISGSTVSGTAELEGYGVMVIRYPL